MVGLVIGIFLGIVITTLDSSDFDRNGKSLRDDIKDFVFGLIDGENGDEKEKGNFKMFYDSNLYGYIFLGCRVNGCLY